MVNDNEQVAKIADALHGLDAARRVGWAKTYALADEVAQLKAEITQLESDLDYWQALAIEQFEGAQKQIVHWIAHHPDAGPVRAVLRGIGREDLIRAPIATLLRVLATELLQR